MKVQSDPPLHLTYCLNVHPGESWAENFAAICEHTLAIRDRVGRAGPFGLGLRLSAKAAKELRQEETLDKFRRFLEAEDLYVFTINGFAYGQFHGTSVKENVYSPDWRTDQRLDYTLVLAEILSVLLDEGVTGSISTVPGSYKPWCRDEGDVRRICEQLAEAAARLDAIHKKTGREICLSMEPEPDCLIETTAETITFFTGPLEQFGAGHLESAFGMTGEQAWQVLRRHIGVCFDTAHLAVEFEDLSASLASLRQAGIRIGKVQLSSALRLRPTSAAMEALKSFCDPIYLHQVKRRTTHGTIESFPDLPAALQARCSTEEAEEWRVHFHVPLFFERVGDLSSTSDLLTGNFAVELRGGVSENLEIETYTFSLLPNELHTGDLVSGILAEYEWVMRNLLGA